jgi:predicted dehydrogenase
LVNKKALIIGLGSAGKRHSQILRQLGMRVFHVSRHDERLGKAFPTIESAFDVHEFDYVVVANETSLHLPTYNELMKLCGPRVKILIEKPLFAHVPADVMFRKSLFVGYNLRFSDELRALKKLIKEEDVLSAQVYAGQYLPDWRPHVDYRESYSSSHIKGGGVLLDLSHEFDYSRWLFGEPIESYMVSGKYSHLEISAPDTAAVVSKMERCHALSISINYTDRRKRREINIQTDNLSISVNLIEKKISVNGAQNFFNEDGSASYYRMHEAVFSGSEDLCSGEDGLTTLKWLSDLQGLKNSC